MKKSFNFILIIIFTITSKALFSPDVEKIDEITNSSYTVLGQEEVDNYDFIDSTEASNVRHLKDLLQNLKEILKTQPKHCCSLIKAFATPLISKGLTREALSTSCEDVIKELNFASSEKISKVKEQIAAILPKVQRSDEIVEGGFILVNKDTLPPCLFCPDRDKSKIAKITSVINKTLTHCSFLTSCIPYANLKTTIEKIEDVTCKNLQLQRCLIELDRLEQELDLITKKNNSICKIQAFGKSFLSNKLKQTKQLSLKV